MIRPISDIINDIISTKVPIDYICEYLASIYTSRSHNITNLYSSIEIKLDNKAEVKISFERYNYNIINIEITNSDGKIEQYFENILTKYSQKHPKKIYTTVAYSNTCLKGYYRYKDLFQISEIKDDNFDFYNFHSTNIYPLILEVSAVEYEKDFFYPSSHCLLMRQVELILSIFIDKFHVKERVANNQWGFNIQPNNCGFSREDTFLFQEGYNIPDLEFVRENFLECNNQENVNYIECNKFLDERNKNKYIVLPDNIDDILEKIFNLNEIELNQLVISAYWFQIANNKFLNSALGMLCLVNAVEALFDDATIVRDRNNFVMKQRTFTAFLKHYADSSITDDEAKLFYDTRSRFTHGDYLNKYDLNAVVTFPILSIETAIENRMKKLLLNSYLKWINCR